MNFFLWELKEEIINRRLKESYKVAHSGSLAVDCTLETGAGCQLRTKGHLEAGLRWLAAGGLAAPLSPGHVSRPGPALASSLPRMRDTSPDPERYRVTLAEYFSLESPPPGVGFHIFIVKLSIVDTGGSLQWPSRHSGVSLSHHQGRSASLKAV